MFVLLWLLSMALHQDDLPPPPVRLPSHPDVPDAEVHREEVSPGSGWHPSLTRASSQAGASKQYWSRSSFVIYELFTFSSFQEKREELRIRRNVYTLSARPRRQVPSMLRQESRVKLRRDSAVSSSLGKVRARLSYWAIATQNQSTFLHLFNIWMNGLSLR